MRGTSVVRVLLGAALAALLTGCAEEDAAPDEARPLVALPSSPSSPTTAAGGAPEAAYLAWVAALEERDATRACAIQHPELTIALRREAILLGRAALGDPCVGFEALLWEDPLREFSPVTLETTSLTEEKATLAADFASSSVTVRMEYQRAAWRVLSEERRTSGTGDSERWVDTWCDLALGSSVDEVVDAMGEPSGEYTVADGGEPQLYWTADQYDFRAYLDPVDGTVTDLVGDYDALSAVDRELLDCSELR